MLANPRSRMVADLALIAVITIAYTIPFLYSDLYYNDGVRYGGIVQEMIERNAWISLTISGEPYLDKPPIYFIVLRSAAELFGDVTAEALLVANAFTFFLYGLAAYAGFRMLGASESNSRIATLMLVSLPICGWFANGLRMDFLFSAAIFMSFAFLFSGLDADRANWRTIAGGALAGIAVLVKGPFGLLFPAIGVVLYLVLSKQRGKLVRRDALAAMACALVLTLLWLSALFFIFGRAALENILEVQIVERATQSVDGVKPWYTYLVNLPLSLLPWILLLIPALTIASIRERLFRLDRAALAWLCFFVGSLAIMQLVAQKSTKYLFPILPAATLWLAVALEELEARSSRSLTVIFVVAAAGGSLVFGAAALAIRADPQLLGDLKDAIPVGHAISFFALSAFAALLVLASVWLRHWLRVTPMIVTTALILTAAKAYVVPGALSHYSPKEIAAEIESALPAGGQLIAYQIYRGTLSFHLQTHPVHVNSAERVAELRNMSPNVLLVAWGAQLPSELAEMNLVRHQTLTLAGRDMTIWRGQ